MEIRIRETGEVVNEVQFSDLHNTTFPTLDEATLDTFGADLVHEADSPTGMFWQVAERNGVDQRDGKWYAKYTLGPVFATDAERNQYIATQKATATARTTAAIKAERDRRIQTGGYKVGAKWYHSDTFSRTQQMGLVMLGASIPAGTQWKTMDGSFVAMTATLAGQIFAAAAGNDIATFAVAESHIAALSASDDPAAYDFSGGWPLVFVQSQA